jgi:NitT/TauT family transport system ATP-binding protein
MQPIEAPSLVLRIKNVRKLYGALEAIRDVSLDVTANEFVSILGPSGCGKSTLLMMIAGVVDKSAGEISIHETPVSRPRPDIGVVFQQ